MHEGCDRGGYYEQGEFADAYGSPLCIVKLGCWGPVVQCNVGKRGWMGGIGGCPNVGGICIGCTMPGFPDKFHAIHESAAGIAAVVRGGHDLRPRDSGAAALHPGIAQQGTLVAHEGGAAGSEAVVVNTNQAEAVLQDLAAIFAADASRRRTRPADPPLPNPEAKYRTLVEQLPAVVFMAYLDRRIGEAYVSPRIEETMGFSQAEWLEDPVRWYRHIHPDDQERWSTEAAEMFLTGRPLRSAYRVHRTRRPGDLVPVRGQDGPG